MGFIQIDLTKIAIYYLYQAWGYCGPVVVLLLLLNAARPGFTPTDRSISLAFAAVCAVLWMGVGCNYLQPEQATEDAWRALDTAVRKNDDGAIDHILRFNPALRRDPERLLRVGLIGSLHLSTYALDHGASPTGDPRTGSTPLLSSFRNPAVTHLLLERGADPNVPDGTSLPLGRAASDGDDTIVEDLLAHHARLDAVAPSGLTALHESVGRQNICERLIRAGADPSLKDKEGRTAADLAQRYNHPELAVWLRQQERLRKQL